MKSGLTKKLFTIFEISGCYDHKKKNRNEILSVKITEI